MVNESVQPPNEADSAGIHPFVAVVDDDEDVADAIAAVMDSQGWRSVIYTDGEVFLRELDLERPPDCVLLDLYLDGIDGVGVLSALSDREAAIPVIVLTARPDGPLSAPAIRAGALEIMTKPVRPEVLLDHVQKAIGES